SSLALLAYGSVVPFFGAILSGPEGTLVIVALAILLLLLAWGICKMKPAAWWIALILGLAASASNFVNIGKLDWADLLSKTGISAEHVDLMKKNDLWAPGAIPGLIAAISAAYLGFVIALWKHFKPKTGGE